MLARCFVVRLRLLLPLRVFVSHPGGECRLPAANLPVFAGLAHDVFVGFVHAHAAVVGLCSSGSSAPAVLAETIEVWVSFHHCLPRVAKESSSDQRSELDLRCSFATGSRGESVHLHLHSCNLLEYYRCQELLAPVFALALRLLICIYI